VSDPVADPVSVTKPKVKKVVKKDKIIETKDTKTVVIPTEDPDIIPPAVITPAE
jgi:hypothetical protein